MSKNHILCAALVFSFLLLTLCWALPAGAAVAPATGEQAGPGTEGAEEGGKAASEETQAQQDELLIVDSKNRYQIRLPAPYWEAESAEELSPPGGGGCPMGQQIPPSLLLVMRNKDAQRIVAHLEKMSERFLMRNESDLENFAGQWKSLIKERAGEGLEFEKPGTFIKKEGMIVHRFVFSADFTAGGGGCMPTGGQSGEVERITYRMVDFFVRPSGEDALLYRLTCIAPAERYDQVSDDFDSLEDSFRFRDQVAERFFAPNAPEKKLPSVEEMLGGDGGGMSASSWLLLAVAAAVLIYMIMRSRGKARKLQP